MDNIGPDHSEYRPAGYAALIKQFNLEVIPNWHTSTVASSTVHRIETIGNAIGEVYPLRYWPGDSVGDQLEFAIKYDGTNLAILKSLFEAIPEKEILAYVTSKPTGKYARRIWFLYEFLTGVRLALSDLKQGNYVDLLEASEYYTISAPRRVQRQRVRNNLLGDQRFCPAVRRSEKLLKYDEVDFQERCQRVVSKYSPQILKRALSYLYTKETKSSFEIESIKPTSSRIERFVSMLQLAEQEDFCDKAKLIELQNRIVDPRFQDTDYRKSQNYVGETMAWQQERIHYVSPKPEDIADLMNGLIAAHRRMDKADLSAVVHATVIAYGFVFLHPFEDGNGRIHRFLVHNILARRRFTPRGLMFPVSASMLKNPTKYDDSLESFSRTLLPLVDYSLDDDGRMTVHSESSKWYRYIDLTFQTESLYEFIEQTIEHELTRELEFIVNYDKTRQAIQEIVDMPDRLIDLFIRFCLQNNGRLSSRKRASYFEVLADEEIERMEAVVMSAYKAIP